MTESSIAYLVRQIWLGRETKDRWLEVGGFCGSRSVGKASFLRVLLLRIEMADERAQRSIVVADDV